MRAYSKSAQVNNDLLRIIGASRNLPAENMHSMESRSGTLGCYKYMRESPDNSLIIVVVIIIISMTPRKSPYRPTLSWSINIAPNMDLPVVSCDLGDRKG
mmetsp:Transcript_114004/g.201182  ORF Transcript_114004/g.201182 Transcript_114004/m.201182 type:complete len:100 (+) Transcript_114004:2074-2373(+)